MEYEPQLSNKTHLRILLDTYINLLDAIEAARTRQTVGISIEEGTVYICGVPINDPRLAEELLMIVITALEKTVNELKEEIKKHICE